MSRVVTMALTRIQPSLTDILLIYLKVTNGMLYHHPMQLMVCVFILNTNTRESIVADIQGQVQRWVFF